MSNQEINPSNAGTGTAAVQPSDDPPTAPNRTVDGLNFSDTEHSDVQSSPERDTSLGDLPLFGSIPRNVGRDYGTSAGRDTSRLPYLVPSTPSSRRARRFLLRVLEVTYGELQNRLGAIHTLQPYLERRVALYNAERGHLEAQTRFLSPRLQDTRGRIADILGRHLAAAAEADDNEMEEVEDEELWGQLFLLDSLMEEDAEWAYTANEHLARASRVIPYLRRLNAEEQRITQQLDWYKEVIFRLAAEVEMDALRV